MLNIDNSSSMVIGLNSTNEFYDSTVVDIEPTTGIGECLIIGMIVVVNSLQPFKAGRECKLICTYHLITLNGLELQAFSAIMISFMLLFIVSLDNAL